MEINILVQNSISWLSSHGVRIVSILIAAIIVNRVLKGAVKKTIEAQIKNHISEEEKRKRIETLVGVFQGALKFIVWIVAFLMILSEFALDITPILTGVGVAGLAVSMAARDVVSDFISGLFIILENQYSVGEKIKVAGVEGKVKEISLRKTIIESSSGVIHTIPNSKIAVVSKKSRQPDV